MSQSELNKNRINNIINIILHPTKEVKDNMPSSLLKKSLFSMGFLTESYFILAFLDKESYTNSMRYIENGFHPFPFLIKPKEVDAKCIVGIDNSQYGIFENTKFVNSYSFSLGKDSSFILLDHTVIVNSKELNKVEYTIDLAYVIYFGDNINRINFYDYLENLVFYSLNLWRSQ